MKGITRRTPLALAGATPVFTQELDLIFPTETWHNHSSSIVELPNGDLLVCWFHGSGERTADDVKILGARKLKGVGKWTEPFEMADTPGFPDTNCTMFVDSKQRLWLFWPVILANEWETALMKYKMTSDISPEVDALR
jgi:predicted neuraminidase